MTVSLWRIASDTPSYKAEDMAGKGAASSGSRWNHAGEHVTYAATSISLAAWETRAHFAKGMMLPWNRILVRIDVPDAVWAARVITPRPLPVGWNVVPEGMISRSIGSAWLAEGASTLLVSLVPIAEQFEQRQLSFITRRNSVLSQAACCFIDCLVQAIRRRARSSCQQDRQVFETLELLI